MSAFKEFTCTLISIFVTLSSDINVDVCNNLRLMLYMYYRTWEILAGKNLANKLQSVHIPNTICE